MTTALGRWGSPRRSPRSRLRAGQNRPERREIDYWNMIGVQNKLVRQLSESIIKAFEQKTGATVNTTWNSYGDIIGPKYRTNFQGGVKPVVFDATDRWTGQLREFLYPMNEFIEGAWTKARKGTCSGCCRWSSGRIAALRTPSHLRSAFRADSAGALHRAPRPLREGRARLRQDFPIRDTDTTSRCASSSRARPRSSTRPRSTARSGISATPS